MYTLLQPTALSPLYEAVQESGIFPDSKFFPDCWLKTEPGALLAAYAQEKDQPGFDLKSFVEAHFIFPDTPSSGYESAGRPLIEHLNSLWGALKKGPYRPWSSDPPSWSSLILLPESYIVPGGRFREVYYWDSYFTMLGLRESGATKIIQDMLENFAYLIDAFGHIPNGNRSYYLSRTQPPFFALMLSLWAEIAGEEQTWPRYGYRLEKEYAFWMELRRTSPVIRVVTMPDGSLLNRYWDEDPTPRPEAYVEDVHTAKRAARPADETYRHLRAAAESGWDFSSRWMTDPQDLASIRTCDFLPVDLNCLLFFMENTLARMAEFQENPVYAESYRAAAQQRKAAILKYCWDADRGFFFDYDHTQQCCSEAFTLAGVFPLFFQIADDAQAAQVARILEEKFLHSGGLVTTLEHSGQQWDAPNGWAPLQWMAFQGLRHYGHAALAAKIRHNWLSLCEKIYAGTGKMMEKYDVENPDAPGGGGEYPNQDGFGWTNGVYLAMKAVSI